MKDKCATADAVASVSSVFDTQNQYTCIFKGLEITHKQNAFIKDTFYFVVSDMKYKTSSIVLNFFLFAGACSYSFGYSHATQPGKFLKDGTVKETKDTLVCIPVLKTLEQLQNEMIVSEVDASKCGANFTIIYHYICVHVHFHLFQ